MVWNYRGLFIGTPDQVRVLNLTDDILGFSLVFKETGSSDASRVQLYGQLHIENKAGGVADGYPPLSFANYRIWHPAQYINLTVDIGASHIVLPSARIRFRERFQYSYELWEFSL